MAQARRFMSNVMNMEEDTLLIAIGSSFVHCIGVTAGVQASRMPMP
jgi:hypothetical protein